MANYFDQFDESAGQITSSTNYFDKFDSQQSVPQQQSEQPNLISGSLQGLAETGRATVKAAVNIANIVPEVGDAIQSAAAWAGNQIGLGDGTYTPAARFSLPEQLEPQTEAGKITSEVLPYLINPAAKIAPATGGLASRIAGAVTKSAAESSVGTLAANSDSHAQGNLAGDLAVNTGIGTLTRGIAGVAGAGYRALRGTASSEAQAAVKFADDAGAPLLTSDMAKPSSFAGRSAQALGEKIPLTGTGSVRREQQASRSKLVEDYARSFAPPAPEEIVQSLKRTSNRVKNAAGQRLQKISDTMAPLGAIQPTQTIRAIDGEIAKLSKLGGVADSQTIGKLQAYKDELQKGADFEQMRNLLSQFRQDVKGDRMLWPNQSQAAANRVYFSLNSEIENAVRSNLGPETAIRYRQANNAYAHEANLVNNTRLKTVLQKGDLTPEVVNNLLFSTKPSEVRQLYTSLDQRGRNAARSAVIGKAYEKSAGSPDRFLNEVNRLSSQTGILFKGQDRQYLQGLTKYLNQTRRASVAGAVTPTGQEFMQVAVPVGLASDVIGTGGVGTAATLTYGALARIYESKPIRNAMLKLANTPRGSSAFESQLNVVHKAMTATTQGLPISDLLDPEAKHHNNNQ